MGMKHKMIIREFKQRISDCHMQNWSQSVNDSSRCHYYKLFKTLLNTERYLSMNLPFKLRIAMSRFRCSSHKLAVETGRHKKIPKELRICQYCHENRNLNIVECEYNVFFECHSFNEIRENYLFNWYRSSKNLQGFINILSSSNDCVLYKTAIYIEKLLQCSQ